MEDLESENLEYEMEKEFLADLRKEFGREAVKVAELKMLEQESKTIEEFIQEFRRTAKRSSYEGRPLVEEFKQGMNEMIQ